jgi:hypothetical protein
MRGISPAKEDAKHGSKEFTSEGVAVAARWKALGDDGTHCACGCSLEQRVACDTVAAPRGNGRRRGCGNAVDDVG